MNLAALMLLPTFIHPMPAIMPFDSVVKRESTQVETWHMVIDKFKGTEAKEINAVNNYWNVNYKYHQAPIWQTPEETFESGLADCKDYATAKYYSLRYLGFAKSRLKLTVVLWRGNQWHAVLVVDNTQVLDSMTPDIMKVKDVNYYQPAYSVNEKYLWTTSATLEK